MSGSMRLPIAVLCITLSCVACDTQDPFAIPTQPFTPVSATETFSGPLGRNSAVTHPFATAGAGFVTATLSTLGGDSGNPDATVTLSVALGTWNGAVCQIVLANDRATQGTTVTGQTSAAASLCIRVSDITGLVGGTTYEIQVVHP